MKKKFVPFNGTAQEVFAVEEKDRRLQFTLTRDWGTPCGTLDFKSGDRLEVSNWKMDGDTIHLISGTYIDKVS